MAVSFDIAATVSATSSSSSITVNLTIGGTANFLVGKCSGYITQPVITNMIWNTSETMIFRVAGVVSGGEDTAIYSLAAPTTGAHSLVVNFSPNTPFGGVVTAESYISVLAAGNTASQSEPVGVASPISTAITVAAGGMAVDCVTINLTALTVDASQTNTFTPGAWGGNQVGASYKADATVMGWSWSGGNSRIGQAVLELTPAAGPTGTAKAYFSQFPKPLLRQPLTQGRLT